MNIRMPQLGAEDSEASSEPLFQAFGIDIGASEWNRDMGASETIPPVPIWRR